MSVFSLIEKITRKRFTEAQKASILGTVKQTCLGYAIDERLRERSASGGAVTALLLHLLESGQVDGALVTEGYVQDNRFKTRFLIATTREELLRAQGSKYVRVNFNRDALPLLREFDGRLAVVALPCDTTNLRRICERDTALNAKIQYVITLFCGHNCEPVLTDHVIQQQLEKTGKQLAFYQHRVGHWRGEQLFVYTDGTDERVKRETFKYLFNLYFFCQQKCLHCHDQFGYHSDISAGDLWHSSMKEKPVKMTALVARTPVGEALLGDGIQHAVLQVEDLSTELLLEGHARTIRGHYNLSARAKAGKLLGFKIKDTLHARVNLWDWLTAFMILFNYRLSTKAWGPKLIFGMPKPIWTLYLYLFKGIESL